MQNKKLPSHKQAVIIGGGVVGCAILFHLAKMGWKDVILLDRKELTSGSSWHAAGLIHTINANANLSRLQSYTIKLYDELEQLSGQSVGMHKTGGFYLASNQDWYDYLKRERSKARVMGFEQEFVSLKELADRHPLIDPNYYHAALWDPLDADIDPSGVTIAYAKAAKHYGADYITHCPVIETNQNEDHSWNVVTPYGTICAEHIVNAAGLWAREVGHLAQINLPVQPMEHHYLITEASDIVVNAQKQIATGQKLPSVIDYGSNIYFRQEGQGLLFGTYEPTAKPWSVGGTPLDFDHELLPPDLDRIAPRLDLIFERIPSLAEMGIKNTINGPFTFGPDGNPLIGPVPNKKNYWAAVGVMAGFCQAGGVGLALANWMIEGEPGMDIWAMDIARFGDYATPDYGTIKSQENYERRFVMSFPNETLPKGRKQKTTALYDRFIEKGAVMGVSFGLEHALWFANSPNDAHETPSFGRNRSHDYVGDEVKAVRQSVGMIEIANFAKHYFKGKGAETFLNHICAGYMPKIGDIRLTPLLSHKGKLYGDMTIARLDEDEFMLFSSGAMQLFHARWFQDHLPNDGTVFYQNLSDDYHGLAISGPKSRAVLQELTRLDVSNKALPFRKSICGAIAGVPVILNRLSFSGELGYEIYCKPAYLLKLYEGLLKAGEAHGIRLYGQRAQMSMRLEKFWGAWGVDYTPDYNAVEARLDGFINQDKDFIGKEAFLKQRADKENKASRTIIMLDINSDDQDVHGDEAILYEGKAIGAVTSGGYAHHVKKSLAFGYVPKEFVQESAQKFGGAGHKLQVEMNGIMNDATIITEALYDAKGDKLRS